MDTKTPTCLMDPGAHPQRGSALVESILIVGVLIIFMAGVPMIGSMIDLKQTTIQASRYSAWEKTVHVNETHAGDLVDERFFRDASSPISSSGNSNLAPNRLWGEIEQPPADQDAALRNANGSVPTDQLGQGILGDARVTIANNPVNVVSAEDAANTGSIYNGVSTVVTTLGSFISPDGWEPGNPVSNGLVVSTVDAKIEGNTFLAAGASMKEHTSIFIDGWAAGDHNTIKERVHGFVPTNRLERVGAFVSKLKVIPMLDDLEHLEKAFGCVKTNIVPGKTYAPVSDVPGSGLTVYGMNPGEDC